MTNPDPDALAEGVAKGVETGIIRARGRWRRWFTDKRLLILYLVGILILAVWVFYVNVQARDVRNAQHDIKQSEQQIQQSQGQIEAAQKAIQSNCEVQNKSSMTFNAFIDQAIQNASNTTGLTPEQKQAAINKYAPLHLAILDCSHLAGQ